MQFEARMTIITCQCRRDMSIGGWHPSGQCLISHNQYEDSGLGKPYANELRALAETYSWAMSLDVAQLAGSLSAAQPLPMLVVGSGGSLTAADFAASLHEEYANAVGKAVTPLELDLAVDRLRDVSVLFLTAGGSNPDILGAFKRVVSHEPRRITVVCARTNSKIASLARAYPYVDVFDFDLPCGRDGFLATNSLLAFSALLSRAYTSAAAVNSGLPADLGALARSLHHGELSRALKTRP